MSIWNFLIYKIKWPYALRGLEASENNAKTKIRYQNLKSGYFEHMCHLIWHYRVPKWPIFEVWSNAKWYFDQGPILAPILNVALF